MVKAGTTRGRGLPWRCLRRLTSAQNSPWLTMSLEAGDSPGLHPRAARTRRARLVCELPLVASPSNCAAAAREMPGAPLIKLSGPHRPARGPKAQRANPRSALSRAAA